MGTVEIKSRIRNTIEGLPLKKLKIALAFLEDLQNSDDAETLALLNEPGFVEDYREAKQDIRKGLTVSWDAIKRDV